MNREPGSGSRALLDKLLAEAGDGRRPSCRAMIALPSDIWPAAYAVSPGEADACIATRSAAQTFGLDFVPLHNARYDLVMRKRTGDLPVSRRFSTSCSARPCAENWRCWPVTTHRKPARN